MDCRSELSSLAVSTSENHERLRSVLEEWDAECERQALVDKENRACAMLKHAKELNAMHKGNLGDTLFRAHDCLGRARDELDGCWDDTLDDEMERLMYDLHALEKKCLCRS